MVAGTAQAPAPEKGDKKAAPPALRPFFTGTLDLETRTKTYVTTASLTPTPLETFYPKTNGWLADLWIRIVAAGGGGAAGTLQTVNDGVLGYLGVIQLSDTGGQPVLGPMTGAEFGWFVKWGGFSFSDDPRNSEVFVETVAATGNGQVTVHIPCQFVRSEPLGPLPNTNSNNAFALDITLTPASVFSALPGTPPVITTSIYQDSYRQSAGKDAQNNATVTTPPGTGAVLYARRNILTTTAGSQDLQLSQQEGSYRALHFIMKDSTGSRVQGDADWPTPVQIYFNNDVPYDRTRDFWIRRQERDYGYVKSSTATTPVAAVNGIGVRDLGVWTLNWITDGGTPQAGYEDRYKYLSVSAADTLGFRGTIGGSGVHTLTSIYNFVRPPGGNIKGLTAR